MATKQVLFCDACDKPESETNPVLPTFFIETGQELCYPCAHAALRKMYRVSEAFDFKGVMADAPAIALGAKTPEELVIAAFLARKAQLETDHECDVAMVSPQEPVEAGKRIKWGNKLRPNTVEVIEPVEGRPGHWFVKIVKE